MLPPTSPDLSPIAAKRDLARLITGIENADPAALRAMRNQYALTGRAHVVGITGAPGSGKSTLVAALTRRARAHGRRVAIVSVDPSSPFSGGALLGDRVRMRELFEDPGVFIRSMANRGAPGGIARATTDVVSAIDAAGYELIFVETVGAGQSEVAIARIADTVVVLEAPGLGDDIQAVKAGILEIADVLVVNKADREGAERTVAALQAALDLAAPVASGHHGPATASAAARTEAVTGWRVPVLQTVATENVGIEAVLDAIERHRCFLGDKRSRDAERMEQEVLQRLRELLWRQALQRVPAARVRALARACADRHLHPDDAAAALLVEHFSHDTSD
jgi:LAO/AO transport system kinase